MNSIKYLSSDSLTESIIRLLKCHGADTDLHADLMQGCRTQALCRFWYHRIMYHIHMIEYHSS